MLLKNNDVGGPREDMPWAARIFLTSPLKSFVSSIQEINGAVVVNCAANVLSKFKVSLLGLIKNQSFNVKNVPKDTKGRVQQFEKTNEPNASLGSACECKYIYSSHIYIFMFIYRVRISHFSSGYWGFFNTTRGSYSREFCLKRP